MKTTTCLFGILLLAGCASTGVVPMGPDTFMVAKQSATGFSSGGEVAADLYREAGTYCAGQGKQMIPVNTLERDGVPGRNFANARLEFRCLAQDDPENRRPTMRPTPNVRIETTTK